jgi:outer membrane receptor for ferrienterochelin and colicin
MQQKYWSTLFLLLLFPGVLFAQSGKIHGTVLDAQSKEPLIGANILIQGTNLGSATDIQGEFVILNVPVGTYTVQATYVGYRALTISNVRVNTQLTTEVDVKLSSEGVQVQAVEIVAERPLINKDHTNTLQVKTSEDLDLMPVRGVTNVLALQASVVKDEGTNTFYIRGGRAEETTVMIDGVPVNNPLSGEASPAFANLSQSAVDELQVQTGGMNADYGTAMSGAINANTKTGSSRYKATGEVITDGFIKPEVGKNGGWGYNVYNLSVSGPILPDDDNYTFYLGAERQYLGDNDPRAVGGYKANTSTQSWNLNGKFMARPASDMEVRVGGTAYIRKGNNWNNDFRMFDAQHNERFDNATYTGFVRFTHNVTSSLFYTVQGGYFNENVKQGDPIFWDNIMAYGDIAQNPYLKAQGTREDPLYNTVARYGRVFNRFREQNSKTYSIAGDVNYQYGSNLFKAGGEFRTYVVRRYDILSPVVVAASNATDPWKKYRNAYAQYYGYTYDGKSVSDANNFFGDRTDGPREPYYLSGYIQDKIELSDLVLNIGIRGDFFDANEYVFKDPLNPFGARGTEGGGVFDAGDLRQSRGSTTISPRLGFSFPITDRAVFHAHYGTYLQMPPLQTVLISKTFADYMVGDAPSATIIPNPDLKPERTTSYEVGFRQSISDIAALGFTGFYKEIKDLIQTKNVGSVADPAYPNSYITYQNSDFGTVKGVDVIFELRRTHNIMFTLNYTLSYANGTGSDPSTQFRLTWLNTADPKIIAPLDYDRRHSGSLNIDYRTQKSEGPKIFDVYPFEDFGVNLLCTFNSGVTYTPTQIYNTTTWGNITRIQPVGTINSGTGPWNYSVNLRIDRSFKVSMFNVVASLYIINLTNAKNVYTVYSGTGEAGNDGFLTSPEGGVFASDYGPAGVDVYSQWAQDPSQYGIPRQIRLGLRLEY